ncbi:MAG: DUF3784 domain-containing protein [Clostridiales bacterium]
MDNSTKIILFITYFLGVIIFIGLSIAIWKYKKFGLISGYKSSKIKDKEGFAKFVSINFIFWALLHLVASVIVLFNSYLGIWIHTIVFPIMIIVMILSLKRYTHN